MRPGLTETKTKTKTKTNVKVSSEIMSRGFLRPKHVTALTEKYIADMPQPDEQLSS